MVFVKPPLAGFVLPVPSRAFRLGATAPRFVGSTLELGGKSPNIVFADADIANASMGVVGGHFAAAGQTCIAGSRVFAHKSLHEELLERVANRGARSIVIGDALLDATELGPLAFQDQRDKVASYVDLGVSEGATVLTGGGRPNTGLNGYFFEPTVLTDVDTFHAHGQERNLRTRRCDHAVKTEEEVLAPANDTSYGLPAGIWTTNLSSAPHGQPFGSRHYLGQHVPHDVSPVTAGGLQNQRFRGRTPHREHP